MDPGGHAFAPLPGPVTRRFQRELTACHELQRPAQLVVGTLDSGAASMARWWVNGWFSWDLNGDLMENHGKTIGTW